jgi:hypothetical protein
MQIDPAGIYRLKKDVLLASFDGRGVLFDLKTRRCIEINQTGMDVIANLNGRNPLSRIIARLADDYDQPHECLQKDLQHFVGLLLERNMIDDGKRTNREDQG